MKLSLLTVIALSTVMLQACNSKEPEFPQAFIGVWDDSQADCIRDISLERLIITAESIQYWESLGNIVKINKAMERDLEVDISVQGEGEEWFESTKYQLDGSTQNLTEFFEDGTTYKRVRCE